jgi:hypothetical protein
MSIPRPFPLAPALMGILPGLVLAMVAARAGAAGTAPPDAQSPFERFKTFLASPPPIESVVFRVKLRQDMTKPARYDGSFARSTNFAMFKAIWQTNALLFYAVTNADQRPEFRPGRFIISVFNEHYWFIDGHNYIQTCTARPGSFDNPVSRSIALYLADLNQVLTGGLMHAWPGELSWQGDRFVAKDTHTPLVPFTASGRLIQKHGLPSEVAVTYSTGPSTADIHAEWKIKYSYARPLGARFFPSRIEGSVKLQGREVEMYECEVSRLTLGIRPQPEVTFDPQPALAKRPMPLLMYTNSALYAVSVAGLFSRLPVTFAPGMPTVGRVQVDRILVLCWLGAVNLPFLVLLARTRLKRNKPKTPTEGQL